MKVRIKFAKYGSAAYVGHLDTMRYFQKAVRRAGLTPVFSEGYSPHMIMSFAAPLGVGMESDGEYFDIELSGDYDQGKVVNGFSLEEIRERLDAQMAQGFRVLGACVVEGGKKKNAMSLVAACDYRVRVWLKEELEKEKEKEKEAKEEGTVEEKVEKRIEKLDLEKDFPEFLKQEEIWITKEGKSGEYQVNIRPFLYEARAQGEELFLRLASASANYTRPDQVVGAFAHFLGLKASQLGFHIKRLEVYAQEEEGFVSLFDLGEKP